MAKLFKDNIIKEKLQTFNIPDLEEKITILKSWENLYKTQKLQNKKEEELEWPFWDDFFWKILWYASLSENETYNRKFQPKVLQWWQKADLWLGFFAIDSEIMKVVVELKDLKTSLDKPQQRAGNLTPVQQAFKYKPFFKECEFVIVSNFYETRLYIDSYYDFEVWTLSDLINPKDNYYNFRKFYYLLCKENLITQKWDSNTKSLLSIIRTQEKEITKKFYKDYSLLRKELFKDIVWNNHIKKSELDLVLNKTQKIIDRIIFIHFCEDLGLLPNNKLKENILRAEEIGFTPWEMLKKFFEFVNSWSEKLGIPEWYNWWLFKKDDFLDNLKVWNDICKKFVDLWEYDFENDLSVNILWHIFEQSISDIEELKDKINKDEELKETSKRKKDGIFYTPEYIVDYIVKNSVGKKIDEWEDELKEKHNLKEEITDKNYEKRAILVYLELQEKVQNIKVLDPACGSGAFLVKVFDFLLEKNKEIAKKLQDLRWESNLNVFDTEANFKTILQNNIYWVDLNEESVEITKLSLWLKTAQKGKKLANLDSNIKCGNSLIDDESVVGDKAFVWEKEFPFCHSELDSESKGFDVIVGNPPYVFTRWNLYFNDFKDYIWHKFPSNLWKINLYSVFLELSLSFLLKQDWYLGFITPETFIRTSTYQDIRKYVFQNFNIKIIGIYGNWVFENVTAETLTMIIKKSYNLENETLFTKYQDNDIIEFNVKQKTFKETPQNRFVYNITNLDNSLFSKLDNNAILLWSIADTRNGIATKAGKNDFLSKVIINSNYKKLLEAPEISRYCVKWSWNYINYDKGKLHRPRNEETFLSEKIVLIRVSPKLVCYYDDWKFYTYNSVNNLVLINNNFSLKYIICLLNSILVNYYYRKLFSFDAGFTITVTKENLDIIPIKNISLSQQQPFIEKADFMLLKNKELQEKLNSSLEFLKNRFALEKINQKLEKFYLLDFVDFKKALNIKKISMTDEEDLLNWFKQKSSALLEIKTQIDDCDKEIDNMVFDLYGLDKEERKVVLGS